MCSYLKEIALLSFFKQLHLVRHLTSGEIGDRVCRVSPDGEFGIELGRVFFYYNVY